MDPSGLHSGREPPVSQRPITYGKDIARVTGKDFYRRPKIFLRKPNLIRLNACYVKNKFMYAYYVKTFSQLWEMMLECWHHSIAQGLKTLFLCLNFEFGALSTNM